MFLSEAFETLYFYEHMHLEFQNLCEESSSSDKYGTELFVVLSVCRIFYLTIHIAFFC